MKICGIVAEYNPFHAGHAYHIEQTRAILGEDCAIVCVMSGNFVQRGECAIMPKQARAKSAIMGGADVVLELPTQFSVAGAEKFANGAISLMESLGNITDLSFGSECADVELLMEAAQILLEHETVAATLVHMKTGISYAAARERALFARMREKAEILSSPNDILGVEYCKAILKLKSSITPHAIARCGAPHDGFSAGQKLQSASHIRGLLREGNFAEAEEFLPSFEILRSEIAAGRAPCKMENGDRAVVSFLRRLAPDALATLPDCSEGLEFRLADAIAKGTSVAEILELAKTKRYARSRLARMVLCAFLGIENGEGLEPYANVLACSQKGREVLKTAQVPAITKPADGKKYAGYAKNAARSDMLSVFTPRFEAISAGYDFKNSPMFL